MLTQMEKEHHLDMTLISEPYKVPEDLTWAASDNGKACIHWNTEGYMSPCIKRKQGHASISLQWKDIVVISCYISPNVQDNVYEEFLDELDDSIMEASGLNVIIGGDFNSKSTLWGCPYINARGDRLERWCASRDLVILNSGNRPTCVRAQGTSIVDLTWCNST